MPNYDYLQHHGIKGQKWGVRRFQNADGSLTGLGKRRRKQQQEQSRVIKPSEDYTKTHDNRKLSELSNDELKERYLRQKQENLYNEELRKSREYIPKQKSKLDKLNDASVSYKKIADTVDNVTQSTVKIIKTGKIIKDAAVVIDKWLNSEDKTTGKTVGSMKISELPDTEYHVRYKKSGKTLISDSADKRMSRAVRRTYTKDMKKNDRDTYNAYKSSRKDYRRLNKYYWKTSKRDTYVKKKLRNDSLERANLILATYANEARQNRRS